MTRKNVSKVLELKGFSKEQLEAEVGKARKNLREEQDRLVGLEQQFCGASEDFSAKQGKTCISVHEHELFTAYFAHLNKQMKNMKEIIAIRRTELERLQAALVEAHKEHRMVELLHDKILLQETKGVAKMEQKEADFAFLTRRGK